MLAVTGANGHIGNTLVRKLLSRGENVRVLIHSNNRHALDGLEVEKVVGDVLDFDSLIKAFKGCDIVFHIAGLISILQGTSDLLYQTNVIGTKNVVNACLKLGIQRLIYTSSIHAILEPPPGMVIDETFPFEPYRTIGDYGRTKARASLEVLKGVKQGLDAVIVCPTAVVGPYDFKPSRMGQFLIDFVKRKLIAYIDGAFDFVDVRDVAMGHILACEKGHIGETYILSGERIAFKELMVILEDISGVEAPRLKVPIPLAMTAAIFNTMFYGIINKEPRFNKYSIRTLLSNSFISSKKAKSALGYSHRPIRKSFEDAIQWFKENNRI